MIAVTGATGRTGSEVVHALLEQGQAVRILVRDRDKAQRLFGDTVELAEGDFAEPASVRAAFVGAEQVFLSCADDPRRVEWETAAIDVAATCGVGRIVKLSSIQAELGSPVAFWEWHGRVEHHLAAAGIPAVILRSSFFMTNLLAPAEQIASQGRLYAAAGVARIAMVDPRDVGAATAAVVATAGHDDCTYVLTGPEAVTYAEVAAEISTATGRAVDFVDVPDDIAQLGMTRAGMPEAAAREIVAIYAMLRQGAGAQVTDTVEALTGRPPRTLADFVSDHKHLFTSAPVGVGR